MYKKVIYCSVLVLIQACSSLPKTIETWPDNLPSKQIFIDDCRKNNECSTTELTNKHLIWVKRFYQGSILYPTGWLEMTEILTSSLINESDKAPTKSRLDALGLKIVIEWAQNNKVRRIDSQKLAIWGRALRTSAEKNEQIKFITSIEHDVDDILSGRLKPEEITQERYYPLIDDYDNF